MLEVVMGQKSDPVLIDALLDHITPLGLTGTAYVGYPVLMLPSGISAVDLLVLCREHGVVAFDLCRGAARIGKDELVIRQRDRRQALELALVRSGRLLSGGKLIVQPRVLTLDPDKRQSSPAPAVLLGGAAGPTPIAPISSAPRFSARRAPTREDNAHARTAELSAPHRLRAIAKDTGGVAGWDDILEQLRAALPIDAATLRFVDAAVQRMGAVRPASGLRIGALAGPRAETLATIEDQLAQLDEWQKAAAIETPEGPQRIRGLAGSGKTVVLAFKAAYLHALHPGWRIVLTFQARTLYEQCKALIKRFYREHTGGTSEPNWERLRVRHAWGANDRAGVYREIASHVGVRPLGITEARKLYGRARTFEGVCNQVLSAMGSTDPEPIYDLVLIDEAQDLPAAFLEMVYRACSHPKRIVWAYDDLQNVMDYVPVSPAQLFGTGVSGRPRVAELVHVEGEPRSDIILPICYRNTPWALTAAHAVGLGVYRIPTDRREGTGIVQFYDDPRVWKEIGYAVMAGRVAPGEHVRLVRDPASTPGFFRDLLDAEDALVWRTFLTTTAEEEWVATEILKNLTDDGLSARDVMVVSANPFFSDAESIPLVRALTRVGVPAHVAGKAGRRDELFGTDGSVPICHINHAKGNEAPMVYVVHAEHGAFPDKVIRRRNTLFAAITRSRAWVRITGSGPGMETIKIELDRVASHGYAIDLSVPTVRELAQMRRLQRDLTTPKRRDRGRASRNGPDVP